MRRNAFLQVLIVVGAPAGFAGSAWAAALPDPYEEAVLWKLATGPIEYVLIPPGTVFQEVFVPPDGVASVVSDGGAAVAGGRLIYCNTLGINAAAFPSGSLISDDITTTAPAGCNLTRFRFNVLGKVLSTGRGGPYTVRYSLYDNCPQAVTWTERGHYTDEPSPSTGIRLRGTDGEITFPDDAPRIIEHAIELPTIVALPTNLWLGVSFTRSNCGVVVGAPAMVGHSADNWDFPGFPCNGNLGGFPEHPHASFNAQLFANADCPEAFVGYKAAKASGPQVSAGPNRWFADDVRLQVDGCQMVGYEVAVHNPAYYQFELREQCNGAAIAGTQQVFTVDESTRPQLQIVRYSFDPPIPVPRDLWFAFSVSNTTGGVVLTGGPPAIGSSTEDYFLISDAGECESTWPWPYEGLAGVFHASITCAGSPPVGACCDMALTQCASGTDDGKRCETSAECAPPGTCESVCREVAHMNCPWPPGQRLQNPAWVDGATCQSNPFPHACGLASCCLPNDTCENLTQNECRAQVAPGEPILWQRGSYCAEGSQYCPFYACLQREGQCHEVHEGVGCSDPNCCPLVCERDPWCCHVDWDRLCVEHAADLCAYPPPNDGCAPDSHNRIAGATLLTNSVPSYGSNVRATDGANDPGFCCNAEAPGAKGFGSVWFKFVATDESAQIDMCYSDPAGDSLVNVFSVGDPSNEYTACQSLSLIGCGDDGCSESGRHSRFCVDRLTPGATYYIMLASKTPETKGAHQLELKSPCQCAATFPSGDCNLNGRPDGCDIIDGTSNDCDLNSVPDECDSSRNQPAIGTVSREPTECPPLPQKLTLDQPGQSFGSAIAVSENWLLIGDPSDDRDGRTDAGAAYLYRRTGGAWVQHAKLTAPSAGDYENFGVSVAVSDDWAIVIAFGPRDENGWPVGTAHLYKREGNDWSSQGLLPSAPLAWWYWVAAILDGDQAALVAYTPGPFECSAGLVVYPFERVGDTWVIKEKLPETGGFGDCGFAIGLGGGMIAVTRPGSWMDDYRLHIFERSPGGWRRTATFPLADGTTFTYAWMPSIGIRDNTVIVPGAFYDEVLRRYFPAGYVYSRGVAGWSFDTLIRNDSPTAYSPAIGAALCRGGLAALLSEESSQSLTVRLHQRTSSGSWAAAGTLPIADVGPYVREFSFAASRDHVVIGTPRWDYDPPPISGAVYSFDLPSTDCDGNGIADQCELRGGLAEDCNQNYTPDQCEPRAFADFDFSARIDLRDFAALQRCFTGGVATLGPCCGVFDAGRDGDVDLGDIGGFVAAMSGP